MTLYCPKYFISLLQRFAGYSKQEAKKKGLIVMKEMEVLSAKTRKDLPGSKFAIPASKSADGKDHLPINDSAHVRNALARKNQLKGVSCGDDCMQRICAAAKKFGIESPLCGGSSKKESEVQTARISEHEGNTGYPSADQQGIKSKEERVRSCIEKIMSTGKSKETAKKLCHSLVQD